MGTARRITSNFLSLTASEVISKIIQLLIFIYIARIFGKSEFGKFGFALAFSFIVIIIADFGFNTLLVREISRNKKEVEKYISNVLTIKIFLSGLTFVATFLYLNLVNYTKDIKIITYLMVLFAVLQSFTDLFYSVFRAFERMYYDSTIKVLRMVVLSALIFISIVYNANLIIVTLMFSITEVFVLVISLILYIKNFANISIRFNIEFIRHIIRKSIFFCLSLIFASLLYIGIVLLQNFKGSDEVGVYTAAFNLLFGIVYIPLMFSNAVFPVFSRYFITDKSLLKFVYRKSFQYMLILGLPISLGIFTYARNIILLLYESNYVASITPLKILSWMVVLRFINITSGTVLSAIDKQGSRVFSQGTVATIYVILNILLIPKFGFIGLSIATIISEILFLVMYSYFIIKHSFKINFIESSIKPIIASILMTLIIINISDLFLGFIVGAISYAVILFTIKAFNKEDKELLMKVIRND